MSIWRFTSSLGLDGEACFTIRRCSAPRIILTATIATFISVFMRVFDGL